MLDEARQLLAKLGTTETGDPEPPVSDEEDARREQALWDWYLEWSAIARTAITARRLLKQLGFLHGGAASEDEVEPAVTPPVAPPVEPTPTRE